MNLKKKILLPLFMAPIAGLLGWWVMSSQLTALQQHTYQEYITAKHNETNALIEYAEQAVLEQAAVFTQLPEVIRAFQHAHQGNINDEHDQNAQQARDMLRETLAPTLRGFEENIGKRKLKLHFHLANGRSLVRLWQEKQVKQNGKWVDISDDLSSFRATVLTVNRSGHPVKGIELGHEGFMIRGVAPIKDPSGNLLGSVEVLTNFNQLLDTITQNYLSALQEDNSLFLFMNAEYLNITHQLRESDYPTDQAFMRVYSSNHDFGIEQLDDKLLKRGLQSSLIEQVGSMMVGIFPVRDYQDRPIGVIAYTLDISADEHIKHQVKMSLVWALLALLLFIGGSIYMVSSYFILTPIRKMLAFISQVRQGNQTIELVPDHADELGEMAVAVQQLVLGQRHVLNQIHHAGVQVTSSATELAATAKEHRATILHQVDSTQSVSDSVEQITTVLGELKITVDRVAALSVETADFAGRGQEDLAQMKEAMHQMEPASKSISSRLEAINDKTENITSVVTTITKVAEQTNLLSLNAAIEAEKAGEYGHGFNVVAREIRRLADQTAVATLDIERMVKDMQSAVAAGVMEMDKFVGVVRRNTEDVGKISEQLSRIIQQVQILSPGFEEVTRAMTQQTQYAQQIRHEINELAEGMRQTSDTLEESFQAIDQLNQAARGLQNEVERFKKKPLDDSLKN